MQLLSGTGKQRAAKSARILLGSTPLVFASWELTPKADDYPTTNFESWSNADQESYDEGIHGPLGCDMRFGGDWDAGANPFGNPPGLYVRDDLANVNFYTSRVDNVFHQFPFIRTRTVTNGAEIRGKVTFQVSNAMSQGRFVLGTSSA